MYVLDTNVISEMRKARMRRGHPSLSAWAMTVELEDLYLSVITIQELEIGVLRAERSRDPRKGEVLRRWLTEYVLPNFRERILPVDLKIALRAAAMHEQRTHQVTDALIASTAWAHSFIMVTRNTEHFRDAGVHLLNPFEPIS